MYERRVRKREILRPACGGTQNDIDAAGCMNATATGYLTPFCPPLHTMLKIPPEAGERGNRGRGLRYKSSPEDRDLPMADKCSLTISALGLSPILSNVFKLSCWGRGWALQGEPLGQAPAPAETTPTL